ncbi:MAG: hypothetical protein OHK0036_20680 [Bacteroidia bacterium]
MNNVIEKIIEEQNSLSEKGILDSLTVNDNVNRLKSIEALLINNQGLAVIKNQISQLKVGDQYKKNLEQYVNDFHNPIQPESENVCEISDSNMSKYYKTAEVDENIPSGYYRLTPEESNKIRNEYRAESERIALEEFKNKKYFHNI